MIKKLLREESGMEMVEWSLVAVLFALVAGLAFTGVGTAVAGALGDIAAQLAAGQHPKRFGVYPKIQQQKEEGPPP